MAIVGTGVWELSFSWRDNNGKLGSTSAQVDSTIIFSDVLGIAAALSTALAAVSDASFIGYSVSTSYVEDAPVAAPETSEVERKLRIPLDAGIFKNASYIEVPSPRFTMELNGTDVVDLADPLIVALRAALINSGGVLGSTGLVTYYGEDITGTGDPVVTHRNRKPRR